MNKKNEISERLQNLKQNYQRRLPDRLSSISQDWKILCTEGWEEDIARQILAQCHQLAGNGKTFGFPNITIYARIVESTLHRLFDNKAVPDQQAMDTVGKAINELISLGPVVDVMRDENLMVTTRDMTAKTMPDQPEGPASGMMVEPLSNLPIYVVEDDTALADYIVMELALHGYDARAVYDLADLDQEIRLSGQTPGAIIMDVSFPDATTGGIDIINKFHEDQILKAPVIFISGGDTFSTRLEIVRAGGDAFFVKPFEINLLIEKLEALVGETNPDPLRVLILDDDAMITDLVCLYLEEAGLDTCASNNPLEIIERVLEFNPDLVILDVYMPEVNGMEVARILRQHEACADMPLLFLSGETDSKIRAQALNIGVDDFLIKPVDRDYLVSAVANRAQRARALGTKIFRDSLTHLLVHDEIKSQLEDQISAAQRQSEELCYVIFDLDNFKQVNDTRGHLTGDSVLKAMAGLMRRSFRRSDVLGRYGGEEFVVIMPNTSIEDAHLVVEKLRQEFSEINHISAENGEKFSVTFSAGISAFPEFRQAEELQATADKALYEAKTAGRNKVCIATR